MFFFFLIWFGYVYIFCVQYIFCDKEGIANPIFHDGLNLNRVIFWYTKHLKNIVPVHSLYKNLIFEVTGLKFSSTFPPYNVNINILMILNISLSEIYVLYKFIDAISLHYLLYLYKIQHELKSPKMWINKCPIPCGKLFHVASCNLTVANAYKYVVYVYSKGAFDWQVEYPPWWLTVGSNFCHVSWNQ